MEGGVERVPLDSSLALSLGGPVRQQIGLHVPSGQRQRGPSESLTGANAAGGTSVGSRWAGSAWGGLSHHAAQAWVPTGLGVHGEDLATTPATSNVSATVLLHVGSIMFWNIPVE